MRKPRKIRLYIAIVLLVIVFIIVFLLAKQVEEKRSFAIQLEQKSQILEILSSTLQTKSDSLALVKDILHENKINLPLFFLDNTDSLILQKKGIKKPSEIINQLEKKTRLIPVKPRVGGKMHFTGIFILNAYWVFAEFSDGHISGDVLFSFKKINDSIHYEVIQTTSH
ncbi:MAG: hypothetical protein ACOCUL_00740 [Bacteroidota bacterium]